MTRTLRTTALGLLLLATGVPRPVLAAPPPAQAERCQPGPIVVVGEVTFRLTYCGERTLVRAEGPRGEVPATQMGEALGHLANLIVALTR